jgi:hypothetical protein
MIDRPKGGEGEGGEEDPFAMLKKKPKIKVEDDGSVEKKKNDQESEGGSSFRKKKGKKKKPSRQPGMLMVSSSKQLELVDDGSVPPVLIKERNETVDLLHQADDKLKKVLEMYVPQRKSTGTSSLRSKTSSKRSKASGTSSSKPR